MESYPKWKYAQGKSLIVADESEEAALEGDWFDSPADVPAETVEPTEEEQLLIDAKAEKEQLLEEALKQGVTVDKRWGIARIKEALKDEPKED